MKILTELQQKVLNVLFADELIKRHFYLTGGTALSVFYLEHRYSDDLDLFTHNIDISSIDRVVKDLIVNAGFSIETERSSAAYRRFRVDKSLQLDLVCDVDFRVGAPDLIDGIMVDTPKNLAVNKVLAIYGRLDPKDYVDLYFLFKKEKFNILELLSLAQKKDAGIEPFMWSRVIMDAESLSILPRMIAPVDLKKIKSFFHKLRDEILDKVKPA